MFSAMGVGFMRLLARLPLTWVRGLGTALGWVLYGVVRTAAQRPRLHQPL